MGERFDRPGTAGQPIRRQQMHERGAVEVALCVVNAVCRIRNSTTDAVRVGEHRGEHSGYRGKEVEEWADRREARPDAAGTRRPRSTMRIGAPLRRPASDDHVRRIPRLLAARATRVRIGHRFPRAPASSPAVCPVSAVRWWYRPSSRPRLMVIASNAARPVPKSRSAKAPIWASMSVGAMDSTMDICLLLGSMSSCDH